MNSQRVPITRSVPTRLCAGAILVAIAGIVVQIATGVKYGTVPPGPIILAVTAALILFIPWPGVRILGVLAPLFIFIGGFASTTGRTDISHPGHTGPFIGTLVQLLALAVAVVAGVVALAGWRAGRAQPAGRASHAPLS
jgi:hypothetical protein